MPPLIGLMPLSNAKDYMSPTLNLIHHHYRSIHKGPKNRYNPPFQIHHHGQSIGMLNGKELIYISFEILLKIYVLSLNSSVNVLSNSYSSYSSSSTRALMGYHAKPKKALTKKSLFSFKGRVITT